MIGNRPKYCWEGCPNHYSKQGFDTKFEAVSSKNWSKGFLHEGFTFDLWIKQNVVSCNMSQQDHFIVSIRPSAKMPHFIVLVEIVAFSQVPTSFPSFPDWDGVFFSSLQLPAIRLAFTCASQFCEDFQAWTYAFIYTLHMMIIYLISLYVCMYMSIYISTRATHFMQSNVNLS